MPSRLTLLSTGPITNMLRNSDSPASTWFGGTDCKPSAFRVSDRTTKILVKLVTSSSSDGAMPRTVMASSTVTDELGLLPPTCTVTVLSPEVVWCGPAGAVGGAGAATGATRPTTAAWAATGVALAAGAVRDAAAARPRNSSTIAAVQRITVIRRSAGPSRQVAQRLDG